MGSAMINDITATLSAMEMALYQLGYVKETGAGVGAAMKILSKS